jgi:glycerol-3-phosphate dehydrogenase (NAD(P)+)
MISGKRACVIGGGAFGTALAEVLASNTHAVNVWVRSSAQVEEVKQFRENRRYLEGYKLNNNVKFTTDVTEAVQDAKIVLLAIPTQFLRSFLSANRSVLPVGVPIVTCAKGIELTTLQFPYDILIDELPGKYHKYFAALSGPSFAKEVVQKQPTSVTVSAKNPEVASEVQEILSSRAHNFRVYTNDDIVGIEVAGAVKNVLAIASGACSGLGFGNNTRAMLVCRGLAEISRLSAKLGSNGKCISGLAGVGDLLLTCSSELSRNFTVGKKLALGASLAEINSSSTTVAEGIATTKALRELAQIYEVDMPICHGVYTVLYESKSIQNAMEELATRPLTSEF